jgi:hypothetical protein
VQEIVPPPVPAPTIPVFEVHEALPAELQQPQTIETPAEVYATPKAFEIANRADFKMNIASLLVARSGLREAILLREILGPPRGLQEPDLV